MTFIDSGGGGRETHTYIPLHTGRLHFVFCPLFERVLSSFSINFEMKSISRLNFRRGSVGGEPVAILLRLIAFPLFRRRYSTVEIGEIEFGKFSIGKDRMPKHFGTNPQIQINDKTQGTPRTRFILKVRERKGVAEEVKVKITTFQQFSPLKLFEKSLLFARAHPFCYCKLYYAKKCLSDDFIEEDPRGRGSPSLPFMERKRIQKKQSAERTPRQALYLFNVSPKENFLLL